MTDWETLTPLRIAFAGDFHANPHFAKRAIRYAKEQGAEVILHVGDFMFDGRPAFLNAVQHELQRAGILLGWVDGNHDHHAKLRALVEQHGRVPIPLRSNIFYLPRTYRWEWSETSFLALGGAHSVDRPWRTPGTEWWPGETISIPEAQRAADDGHADVMICHDAPAGVRIPWIENNPFGFPQAEIDAAERHRELLRKIVDQVTPHRLFAGHYHGRLTGRLDGGHYRTVVDILGADQEPVSDNTIVVDPNKMFHT